MDFSILADPFTFIAGFGIIGILLAVLTSIFWLWMLIDAITSSRSNSTEKLVWILVIFFGHILGALIYFFVGRGGVRGGPVA